MPEKRNKCNILDLKVQKQFFLKWFEQFLSIKELYDECSTSVSVEMICFEHFDPMKNSILGYFCKFTYCQMHRKFQTWCLFGGWLLCYVLWFGIFYPHVTSHVFFAKVFKHLQRKGLRNLGKYTLLWFNSDGRKILVNSSKKHKLKKYKFFSSRYYFPLYISLLILDHQ